ncbi:MAG: ParA family protein, partial [Alistipes shahii]
GGPVYRCTLLPPDRAFVAECGFDRLMTEICAVLKLPSHE